MEFLVDSNLGLPVDEKPWSDILAGLGITTTLTNDLEYLDRRVERHEPDVVFMPIADFHRLLQSGDTFYRGFVLVTSRITGSTNLPSVLVVRSDDPAQSIEELRGATLGYINTSCSSSYFCPAIVLHSLGEELRDFFDTVPTAPWQGQIDAVIDGTVRATMVVEDIWRATPSNAVATKVIGRYDDATGAVIVIRDGVDDSVRAGLLEALLAWQPRADALFGPFTRYRDDGLAAFFADMDRLPAGF
ncbi:PhnD/SsuA/transferrin family substrate-binding protein [Mycobacterium sp. 236(2023)]|uniref:phosphate/phosphite/phosphonate ABC transporter substrate-binding protein n=1 Tax=Mycobacterium sp. 236(2023) TaxID=3038163 RepID=UPI002414D4D5|nr:PhnD/SsuA/transferrin family substrate-binding protein [Mycobacterium sp. 236(2023)]MDG4665572.1 PhnD/SsuA/transferrin family substrate-binding protein [Mycobacterium sp. 236(2023)]